MTDGLLANIIQLEKLIQLEVAEERLRAEVWQQREIKILQDSLATLRDDEEERFKQQLERLSTDLQCESAALEATSSAWCRRLSKLEDERLIVTLRRHLAAILPGGEHDHPHGKS